MLQIRSIVLRGKDVKDAVVTFEDRANILAGESDTGKSYLVHCLDYILGADKMRKRIDEDESYSQLFVEFENSKSEFLTLERSLSGGALTAYSGRVSGIENVRGEIIASKRTGRSQAKDVTAVLFAFAGIEEAMLRKNDRGEVNRLTIRTMLSLFVVDEISIIDERSPILGKTGFDNTARKRAFAYMLSGIDDAGIIASEKEDVVSARLDAQLSVISDLLSPIEQRLNSRTTQHVDESIDKIDATIAALSQSISDHSAERISLEKNRRTAIADLQRAESQIIAINELIKQYRLLDDRYRTDLERLDFIAEGAYFFGALQEVMCPLCDQLMSPDHAHKATESGASLYQESARAEASKILAHRKDLAAATETLTSLRSLREKERDAAQDTIRQTDANIASILAPAIESDSSRLDELVARRIELEGTRSDEAQASILRTLKDKIEKATEGSKLSSKDWAPLPAKSLQEFCAEVEAVLKEWKWEGDGRVEFDESEYDIKVDGKRRQSHGKGVRAVLYSAFVIGLLRYCHTNGLPHPGVVIIDSPLTSYKKGKTSNPGDKPINAGIESAFWHSLRNIEAGVQFIVIENKEPPSDVAKTVHYEWFAGESARPDERRGFIPQQA